MQVKEGTLWYDGVSKRFRVLHIVEDAGNTWIHYRDELPGFNQSNSKEYSCYLESFISRFRPLPE